MGRMSKLTGILMTLLGLFLLANPAQAGGWVVITLDALPGPVHAGDTLHLGFMVRQHGVTPIDSVSPTLSAVNRQSAETVTADAEQSGETGHFQVAIVFPEAGQWDWQISAPPFPQQVEFEALTVLPAASAPPASAEPSPSNGLGNARTAMRWSGVGLLGLAGLLALTTVVRQRRRQEAAATGPAA